MIFRGDGDLLKTPADALVNTVNTVGVMGKGIALQFKLAFPDNYAAYEAACKRGDVQIGKMFVFRREKTRDSSSISRPRNIGRASQRWKT